MRGQTSTSSEDPAGMQRIPRMGGTGGTSRRVSSFRTRSPYGGIGSGGVGGTGGGGGETNYNMASVIATAALSTERCPWCQVVLETHDETTIGLGLVCLATFVHRGPGLAAPFLIDMLTVAARIANSTVYTWQKAL